MSRSLIAGSRDSLLALTQTEFVMARLREQKPELELSLKTFKTQGDLNLESSLSSIGDKGLFVKELEVALLKGEIDFAVHSMKDMPSEQPEGLYLMPFGHRETPLDALVSKSGKTFEALPSGSTIGTSSLRRQALLLHHRPDLNVDVVRGNVQTRLKKLDEGPFDAIILAAAGLHRLGLDSRITELLAPPLMIPACCQGTLAIEFADPGLKELFAPLADRETAIATQAERAFMRTLEGGCQVPMGAYARPINERQFQIDGMIADPTGTPLLRAQQVFTADGAEQAGCELAKTLLKEGGSTILNALRKS